MDPNNIHKLAEDAELYHLAALTKVAYIRKLPNGKYRVFSEKGKNMGTYNTREEAKKRLGQIEYFKHKKASNDTIDLSHLSDLNYSAIVRELRKINEDVAKDFITIYKQCFDKLMMQKYAHEQVLPVALLLFNKQHKIKLPSK